MKANQCQHFHRNRCRAPDAPQTACVLLDIRATACRWFALLPEPAPKPPPPKMQDYLEWAERRVAARRKSAENNGRRKDTLYIPKFKDLK